MMRVWSQRPRALHLGLFTAAYVLACGFTKSVAIVPGTGISIWPAGGLFIATLVLSSRYSWPWWLIAGCLAELFSNVLWFRNPLPAALLINAGNALEAVVGAALIGRVNRQPVRLETLREVLALVALGAGVAPGVSATVGAATLAYFDIQSFATAWPLWWIGDATGVLIVAPLALVVIQNWRGKVQFSAARWLEAGAVGLIFLAVASLSLSGFFLPFAYIIAAAALGRGAFRVQRCRCHPGAARFDHTGVHALRRQSIRRRCRVPEAKARDAAAVSGELRVLGADRRCSFTSTPASVADVARE